MLSPKHPELGARVKSQRAHEQRKAYSNNIRENYESNTPKNLTPGRS